jgi:predicted DNA-binding transcriptional regulator AlpA
MPTNDNGWIVSSPDETSGTAPGTPASVPGASSLPAAAFHSGERLDNGWVISSPGAAGPSAPGAPAKTPETVTTPNAFPLSPSEEAEAAKLQGPGLKLPLWASKAASALGSAAEIPVDVARGVGRFYAGAVEHPVETAEGLVPGLSQGISAYQHSLTPQDQSYFYNRFRVEALEGMAQHRLLTQGRFAESEAEHRDDLRRADLVARKRLAELLASPVERGLKAGEEYALPQGMGYLAAGMTGGALGPAETVATRLGEYSLGGAMFQVPQEATNALKSSLTGQPQESPKQIAENVLTSAAIGATLGAPGIIPMKARAAARAALEEAAARGAALGTGTAAQPILLENPVEGETPGGGTPAEGASAARDWEWGETPGGGTPAGKFGAVKNFLKESPRGSLRFYRSFLSDQALTTRSLAAQLRIAAQKYADAILTRNVDEQEGWLGVIHHLHERMRTSPAAQAPASAPSANPEEMLTAAQAAKRMGTARSALYKLYRRGVLPGVVENEIPGAKPSSHGNQLKFRAADIERLISERKTRQPSSAVPTQPEAESRIDIPDAEKAPAIRNREGVIFTPSSGTHNWRTLVNRATANPAYLTFGTVDREGHFTPDRTRTPSAPEVALHNYLGFPATQLNGEPLLSTPEVAERAGVTPQALRAAIKAGRLASVVVRDWGSKGFVYRFRQSDIERLFGQSGRHLTTPEAAEKIGVGPAQVNRYARSELLPGTKPLGQAWRFRESDILDLRNSRPGTARYFEALRAHGVPEEIPADSTPAVRGPRGAVFTPRNGLTWNAVVKSAAANPSQYTLGIENAEGKFIPHPEGRALGENVPAEEPSQPVTDAKFEKLPFEKKGEVARQRADAAERAGDHKNAGYWSAIATRYGRPPAGTGGDTLSAAEVADRLGMSIPAIYKAAREGRLPVETISEPEGGTGSKYKYVLRFPSAEIDKLVGTDKLLSAKEAARALRTSTLGVAKIAREGRLTPVKVLGGTRFRESEVLRLREPSRAVTLPPSPTEAPIRHVPLAPVPGAKPPGSESVESAAPTEEAAQSTPAVRDPLGSIYTPRNGRTYASVLERAKADPEHFTIGTVDQLGNFTGGSPVELYPPDTRRAPQIIRPKHGPGMGFEPPVRGPEPAARAVSPEIVSPTGTTPAVMDPAGKVWTPRNGRTYGFAIQKAHADPTSYTLGALDAQGHFVPRSPETPVATPPPSPEQLQALAPREAHIVPAVRNILTGEVFPAGSRVFENVRTGIREHNATTEMTFESGAWNPESKQFLRAESAHNQAAVQNARTRQAAHAAAQPGERTPAIETTATPIPEGQTGETGKQVPRIPGGAAKGAVAVPQFVGETARFVASARRSFQSVFNPTKMKDAFGKRPAERAGQIFRQNWGEANRHVEEVARVFDAADRAIASLPEPEQIEFMRRENLGQAQPTADLQTISNAYRWIRHQRKVQVAALAKRLGISPSDIFDSFAENHFPARFKRIEDGQRVLRDWPRLRSILGPQGFKHPRTHPDLVDAIDAAKHLHLELATANPIDLLRMEEQEFQKYLSGLSTITQLKQEGLRRSFSGADVRAGKVPPGWVEEPTDISKVFFKKGNLLAQGRTWYVPEPVAFLLRNALDRGLWDKGWYRTLRVAGNALNAWQLGFSGFHALMIGGQSSITDMELGIREALSGKPEGAIKIARGTLPGLSLVHHYFQGRGALENIRASAAGTPLAPMVQAFFDAGGNLKLDREYVNGHVKAFTDAIHQGRALRISTMVRAPFAAAELVARPLFENLIPLAKLGAFLDQASHELHDLDPVIDNEEYLRRAQGIHDSMDNRFGLLNYDNLFWDKHWQNTIHLVARAPGWYLGTMREYGGATYDLLKGNPSRRVSYALASLIAVPIWSSIYQYAMTGTVPKVANNDWETWRNFTKPLTGRTLEDGTPERLQWPSYLKDLEDSTHGANPYATDAGMRQYLAGKQNPILAMVTSLLSNRDWRNQEIFNPDASLGENALNVAKFVGKENLLPISAQNLWRRSELEGAGEGLVNAAAAPSRNPIEAFFGMTIPKARWLGTPLRNALWEAHLRSVPTGPYTPEQMKRRQFRNAIVSLIRKGQFPAAEQLATQGLRNGMLDERGLKTAITDATTDPLERALKQASIRTLLDNFRLADPGEQKQLIIAIGQKAAKNEAIISDPKYRKLAFYILTQFDRLVAAGDADEISAAR